MQGIKRVFHSVAGGVGLKECFTWCHRKKSVILCQFLMTLSGGELFRDAGGDHRERKPQYENFVRRHL